jgi:hypothetical protein
MRARNLLPIARSRISVVVAEAPVVAGAATTMIASIVVEISVDLLPRLMKRREWVLQRRRVSALMMRPAVEH